MHQKPSVLAIHGGEAYTKYDHFLQNLRDAEVNPFAESQPDGWRKNLPTDLGADFEVILPSMPNTQNSKYIEWKIWFEKYLPFLTDKFILVGHSQGAMFLARYIAECEDRDLLRRIRSAHLVAGAYNFNSLDEADDGGDFFAKDDELSSISQKVPGLYLYHSRDDFVVPYSNAELFHNENPKSTLRTFDSRGHFLEPHFPELCDDIKSQV